jgi:hypothetical protein
VGSNVTTVGNFGGVLLGRYGVFGAGRYGNTNANAQGAQVPLWTTVSNPNNGEAQQTGNVIPANLSTQGTQPGSNVTNGNYAGQGITGTFDSGPILFQQCTGWTKWGVMVRPDIPGGTVNGLSATIYGTWDVDTANGSLTTYNTNGIVTSSANSNWFQLPSPSQQSGETTTANPLTGFNTVFWNNWHLVAIRINVTNLTSGSILFNIFVGV